MKDPNVFVIGVGRMGLWFIRLIKKAHDWPIRAYDSDETALKNYAIEFGFNPTDTLTDVTLAKIIFVATPIRITLDMIKFIASFVKKDAWIIEIASLKKQILPGLRLISEKYKFNILSIHPLFGPNVLDKSKMKFALIPVRNEQNELKFFRFVFGDVDVEIANEEEHDKAMAYNLTLIHMVNNILHKIFQSADKKLIQRLSTSTYKMQTEIMNIVRNETADFEISLLLDNEYARDVVEQYGNALQKLLTAIDQNDRDVVFDILYK